MPALNSFNTWFYIMIIGAMLMACSVTIIGNGHDKKMRQLNVKFSKREHSDKSLAGAPLVLTGRRTKPILLVIGALLCLAAYITIIVKYDVIAYAVTSPLYGSLFIIPVILLLAIIVIAVCIFLTKLQVYQNALVKKHPLQRKTYYYNDFEGLEVNVYADSKISYRAFAIAKNKTMLKLWLRKTAHFEALHAFLKDDARVAEITKDRLDTPYYARLIEQRNA